MKKTSKIIDSRKGRLIIEYRFTAKRFRGIKEHDLEALDADEAAERQDVPEEGRIYKVGIMRFVGPQSRDTPIDKCLFSFDHEEGWGGISREGVKRYHGWRGTINDFSFMGYGVRRCLSVTHSGKRSRLVRIVFGKDLKPNEP